MSPSLPRRGGGVPAELQGKLLRVLQEGEFERLGDDRTQKVDVRILAATNRNLAREIKARRFREDLYFRLSVFPLEMPPVRARPEDIPLLAAHFLRHLCRCHGLPEARLKRRHLLDLQAYNWPGNVRELQNVIERAVVLSRRGPLRFDLPETPTGRVAARARAERPAPAAARRILSYRDLRRLERDNVLAALASAAWKISGASGAAALLGLKPSTLSSRMNALGIERR